MSWKTVRGNGIELGSPTGGTMDCRVVWDPRGTDVAYVVNVDGEGDSNAALIAAAPDLFNACREMFDAVIDNHRQVPARVVEAAWKCRAAYSKAITGKEATDGTQAR
jgi:hypothetical protein